SSGKRENLAGLPVALIEGDVADYEAVARAVHGCQLVFHQAALVSVPRSIEAPDLNHRSNVNGTFNIFEAARRAGVGRVVYASSAAVYGDEPSLPKHEASPIAPLSPYGAAKYIAEVYAAIYAATYGGPEFVGLRYMNVFGPRQDPSSPYSGVLSIFCRAALNGRTCHVYGDGEQTRDFVYISDVVQANLLAAATPLQERSAVFNIGRGQQTSLNQIIALLDELTPDPVKVVYEAERRGDIRHSVADISRARARLGYEPQVSVRDGLRATLDWLKKNEV
ncbi:MAG: NAD-dependent epimerase/dehydratase family protein, partial [Anaerolineae bacterium]